MSSNTHDHDADDFDPDLRLTAALVRAGRPGTDAAARDRLLFESGRAAGARAASRWTAAWGTAACLFAASTIGLLATQPPGAAPRSMVVERGPDPVTDSPATEIAAGREAPRRVDASPTTAEPRTLRAADRQLDRFSRPAKEAVAVAPGDARPPLTPIRAWRDLDSI